MKKHNLYPLHFIFIFVCFIACTHIQAQPECDRDIPFTIGSNPTVCAENGVGVFTFLIDNKDGPGDYWVRYPDGSEDTIFGLVADTTITFSMEFDCDNMPGNPTPPNALQNHFIYDVIVDRIDCVVNQEFSTNSASMRVFVNPINEISTLSPTECLDNFQVYFDADICDVHLVEAYSWYVDGVFRADSLDFRYTFPDTGSYTIVLETTIDAEDCGPFADTLYIDITAAPRAIAALDIDASLLCDTSVEIGVINNSQYADSFTWATNHPDIISFSDNTAAEPTIFINNAVQGTYTVELTAYNDNCNPQSITLELTTLAGQSVLFDTLSVVCSQTIFNTCDYIDFIPTPSDIEWLSSNDIIIDAPTELCTEIEVLSLENFTLTLTGVDTCGNVFSHDIEIPVTPSQELSTSEVEPLCENSDPINLLDYISSSEYVVFCMGNGVTDCMFHPLGNTGNNTVMLTDSCGISYELEIYVQSETLYQGGDIEVCVGDSLNLTQIQPGIYSADEVTDNVFYSDIPDSYTIEYLDTLCSGTSDFEITVIAYPTAGFSFLNTCIDGENIYLEGATIDINSTSDTDVIYYEILETEDIRYNNDDSFSPLSPGGYTLQQIVGTSEECSDTITQIFTVESLYSPNVFAIDTIGCDSATISFVVQPYVADYQYFWTFSNGESSNIANPIVSFPLQFVGDTFEGNLTVVTNCESIELPTVQIELPELLVVSFGIENDNDEACSGEKVCLQNSSLNYDSLTVTYGDTTVTTFPDSLFFENNSDSIMYVDIILVGFKDECPPDTAIETLILLPVTAIASFSLNYDTICSPSDVTIENLSTPGATDYIIFGDGSTPQPIGSLEQVTYSYNFDRDTIIFITLISELCGIDTFRRQLNVYASTDISFTHSSDGTSCTFDSVSFTPSQIAIDEGVSFEWDFGDGNTSFFSHPSHIYETEGTYTVTFKITDSNGCVSIYSSDVEISNYSGIQLTLNPPDGICINTPFELNIIGDYQSIDYGNGTLVNSPLNIPYTEAGEYDIVVTSVEDDNDCVQYASHTINVFAPPSVNIVPEQLELEAGQTVELSFEINPTRTISEILWEGDSIDYPQDRFVNITPTQSGNYYVTIIDEYGCTATDSVRVSINNEYDIFVPNAFTPDGNGVNDTLFIHARSGLVENIKLFQIYDRWGEKVFEMRNCDANDSGCGWDGYFRSRVMDNAVFVWYAEIDFINGVKDEFQGDVTLIK